MFARTVSLQLKPNSVAEFTKPSRTTSFPCCAHSQASGTELRLSSQAARSR